MSYNGWTNWDTWEAFNWLSNDESEYHLARDAMRCCDTSYEIDVWIAAELFEFFFAEWLSEVADLDPTKIDWTELALAFTDN